MQRPHIRLVLNHASEFADSVINVVLGRMGFVMLLLMVIRSMSVNLKFAQLMKIRGVNVLPGDAITFGLLTLAVFTPPQAF